MKRIQKALWRIWPLSKLADVLDERDSLRDMTEAKIKSLSLDERGVMVVKLSHAILPILTESLAKAFEDAKGVNYVEAQFETEKLGPMTVTVQRRNGKTPAQLLDETDLTPEFRADKDAYDRYRRAQAFQQDDGMCVCCMTTEEHVDKILRGDA